MAVISTVQNDRAVRGDYVISECETGMANWINLMFVWQLPS